MPAGRGNQCERCYVEGLAEQRTKFNRAAFRTPTIAGHFGEFGVWLKTTRGPEKAAQRVHRFVPFFLEIEREWGTIPEYGTLLEHFRSEETPVGPACHAVDGGVGARQAGLGCTRGR